MDTFGRGSTQFTVDFVSISANPGVTPSYHTSGSVVETFTADVGVDPYTNPGYDYRMAAGLHARNCWRSPVLL